MTEAAVDGYTVEDRQHLDVDFIKCRFCGASNSKYRRECRVCGAELGA